MRATILRSAAVIAVGGVILAGVLYVASTVDARAPQVLAISITQTAGDDQSSALVNTSIEIEFNEPVDQESAVAALRVEPAVEGATSWSGSTLTFTPTEPLELETDYLVTVAPGVQDLNGNVMEEGPEPFAFATVGRPRLAGSDPADGSEAVPLDAAIEIVFSTLMDTASVEAALEIEPAFDHELRWSGEALEIVPAAALESDREYTVTVGAGAADVAGVDLAEPVSVTFRTVAPGIGVERVVPADGVDGIAVGTPIAIMFDRPIDPASVDADLLVIEPEVAGTLEIVALPDEPLDEDGAGRVLRFTPSASLPANTTFTLRLEPGLATPSGGGMADATEWSFTTGVTMPTVSNQVTFLTDRSGIPNVWAMNPDGTGQRQLSAELSPIVDYAVAPDGSSIVVADGRRLVQLDLAGAERRVLTDDGVWEFDPAYAPNGQQIAFARADATTGEGLGLWTREVDGGPAAALEIPPDLRGGSSSPDPDAAPGLVRAPRYAPDGLALAFVAADGALGVVELPGQRHTRIEFGASAPPTWLPDSSALLVTGVVEVVDGGEAVEAPVMPLLPRSTAEVFRLGRSATAVEETVFARGWLVLAVAPDGAVAFVDAAGGLGITTDLRTVPAERIVATGRVVGASFAPDDATMVIAVEGSEGGTRIERLDLATGERELLAPSGTRPRWLP
jgi:hypothetical protein